jgi:hypothetical protein
MADREDESLQEAIDHNEYQVMKNPVRQRGP